MIDITADAAVASTSVAAFQEGNPLLLTTEGEFVVKNLVLITACLVLMSAGQPQQSEDLIGASK